jgi:DNA-binding Lrp family transcriptional regulator
MKNPLVVYILIKLFGAGSEEVAGKIRNVKGITEAKVVFGEYDIVARAQVDSIDELGHVVMDNIQRLNTKIDTITLIART